MLISDLVDSELFARTPIESDGFDSFLDGVVVIALSKLGQDDRSKNMLVAIMLNMFYERMLKTTKRPYVGTDPQLRVIDSFLLVDEADNIMRYEFDVLRKILLQGREFGTGVILASQYLKPLQVWCHGLSRTATDMVFAQGAKCDPAGTRRTWIDGRRCSFVRACEDTRKPSVPI